MLESGWPGRSQAIPDRVNIELGLDPYREVPEATFGTGPGPVGASGPLAWVWTLQRSLLTAVLAL